MCEVIERFLDVKVVSTTTVVLSRDLRLLSKYASKLV